MPDQLKQIREFPNKTDFGDEDLLLIQGSGTTYNVKGSAVKRYAEDAAKPQVELAKKEAAAAAEAAERAEEAIQHPALPDPATGNWVVWDQVSGGYNETVPPLRAEGQDFEIKGYYPTLEALEAAVPEPEKGYAYGIGTEAPYDIYVWDKVHGVWVNNGPMTASGDMLKSKYDPQHKEQDIFAYADAAHVGKSMAGQTVEPEQGTTVTAGEGAEVFNTYKKRTYGTDEGHETVVPMNGNVASGIRSHAEGECTTASGRGAHAEGSASEAKGNFSHAEGARYTGQGGCVASGYGSHAEGVSTEASNSGAHSEGRGTKAEGIGSHAEGQNTAARKDWSHAEGGDTLADGLRAHAEGYDTQAIGGNSHAEGYAGIAEGGASHVEGGKFTSTAPNKATGYASHVEGASTLASGDQAHAEGDRTTASGRSSHAEGASGTASGITSHVEGGFLNGQGYNKASGYAAHSEGASTEASGDRAHSEGELTVASGVVSHAQGSQTQALSPISHTGGIGTVAEYYAETAIGRWNVKNNPDKYTYAGDLFVIGKGTSETERSNTFRVNHGSVFGVGPFNSSGADYAERFEWADGNPDGEDRVGLFVTLSGPHIRVAGPEDDYLLGIISGSPSVVGDVYDDQWKGMYLTDVFGQPIWEEVEVPAIIEERDILRMEDTGRTDEAGNPILEETHVTETVVVEPARTERRQKLNPAYDPTQKYVPQSERPEKANVGLLGKLVALEDGSCKVDGYCTAGEGGVATASESRTRFRVMEKLTDPETGRKCVRILIL